MEVDGRWDSFTASWVYPKPTDGAVPVALGNAGPLGIEQRVNTNTSGDQTNPDVAMRDGFFQEAAIVWEGPDIDGTAIYAQ